MRLRDISNDALIFTLLHLFSRVITFVRHHLNRLNSERLLCRHSHRR